MSWLARSIANTLRLDDEDAKDTASSANPIKPNHQNQEIDENNDPSTPVSPSRGVKEDISELTKTLTSQFWGVASFLGPPPPLEQVEISGIRNDFAEIGGKFRSGISSLSSNMGVLEFTKRATDFLQLGESEEQEGEELIDDDDDWARRGVGVSEEVLAFTRDIASHPETWLDFPLLGSEDDDDFDMSASQQEHALAVEHLTPSFAAMRTELCSVFMSDNCFWKIYFVLLHPRLAKQDSLLLSTPQILEARDSLSKKLYSRNVVKQPERTEKDTSNPTDTSNPPHAEFLTVPKAGSECLSIASATLTVLRSADDSETEKHPVTNTDIQVIDKHVIEEKHVDRIEDGIVGSSNFLVVADEDDCDDWLQEEISGLDGARAASFTFENEEDVSFSDLEEDDGFEPKCIKKVGNNLGKENRDWVQPIKTSALG